MVKSKVWVMAHKFHGAPKLTDFEIIEEELPPLKDGEFLSQCEFISLDPVQRVVANMLPEGTPMIAYQVAKIIESKNPNFPVGKQVMGNFGWRTHSIGRHEEDSVAGWKAAYILPDLAGLPASAAVGVLGMPGMTAYFGTLEYCLPKAGETFVVNAAAGAVGSTVGQLAKLMGCRVIGYAGDDEKLAWLKNELKFDYVFNYKKVDLAQSLKEAAPKGVDCFFDNVGGIFAVTVLAQMNKQGRVCSCGSISGYNALEKNMIPDFFQLIGGKELVIRGMSVSRFYTRWPQAIKQMCEWIREGKIKFRETVMDGFESTPQALIDILAGKNFGKMVVKV